MKGPSNTGKWQHRQCWKCITGNDSCALFWDVQKPSQEESGPTILVTMAASVALGKSLSQALWDCMPLLLPMQTPHLCGFLES